MKDLVIKVENLSKQYRLGLIGTGTISHDLNRWWARLRGKDDPFLTIGDTNNRESVGQSDYVWSLKDINFELKKGEVLGVIGQNGAGKSTLLKILSKVTGPTTGKVMANGRIGALLEVGTGFHPELTGRENIFLNGAILGMSKAEIKSKLDEIIDFSGCARYIETPVKRYSSGMKVRLAFAVAAFLDPEILIVDEVLAVGDAEFQKKAIGKIQDVSRGEGRTVLFVSHNMAAVRSICDRVILLDQGRIHSDGDASEIISTYLSLNTDLNSGIETKIPSNLSQHNNGKAKFKELSIINEQNEISNQLFFHEQFSIKLKLEVLEDLEGSIITVIITNAYGEKILTISNEEHFESVDLKKGIHEIDIHIVDRLMPGEYSFFLMLAYRGNGTAIDVVDRFYPFGIDRTNKDATFEYPWQNLNGYVQAKSKMLINKID